MSSLSSFFHLCPDILLHLFEYFSLNELFDVFIDLIPSLPNLLNESHRKCHIDSNATADFWNRILPKINSNQILSIYHSRYTPDLSIYSSLQSIHLNLQSCSIFRQVQSLIHLKQLSIGFSEEIIEEQTWLLSILTLPELKRLKMDLNIPKNTFIPQRSISINNSIHQSKTIECLQMNIPMSYQSLLVFLHHFPNLKTFRALLYRPNHSPPSIFHPPLLRSLQTLDLQGYFQNMSSMINLISSSMPNLKHCRLRATNVTDDDAFGMQSATIWKAFFEHCSNLLQVRIHLLMSIEGNDNFSNRTMKDLLRAFNSNSFCEKYSFQMEQISINRGYVTLTANYQKKKKNADYGIFYEQSKTFFR